MKNIDLENMSEIDIFNLRFLNLTFSNEDILISRLLISIVMGLSLIQSFMSSSF